ncbi:MAG TPA: hypothetical protein VMV77_14995 [Bacteroidales bacterium]|nr:hypothetical protein [Bacteroidales bacterium]
MIKKLLIIAVISISGVVSLNAQGELNEQQKVFFRNERSYAILLNSDGIGVSYRAAKRIDYLNKSLIEIEAGTLKHPREYKLSNPYIQSAGSFVFGKLNTVIYLRGGLGHQHELFKKADLGGIAIRYFYSAGPVMAIYKPIYYKVLYPVSLSEVDIKEEKFNVSIALPQDIYSKASFTKGLNETKVLPGLFAKGGFNFEYSKEDKVIHAIEIGAQINAFPKKIPIMASSDNKTIYFSLFASYRFGMILDPLNPESNKLSNIFKRKKNY